jgi:hypothetical protein
LIARPPPRARSIPRENEGAGRDFSASSASDVIDKEYRYAGVRLWPEASVGRIAAIRSESGVKPTCQDGPIDAIDPIPTSGLPASAPVSAK